MKRTSTSTCTGAVAVGILAVTLAACGSDDSSSDSSVGQDGSAMVTTQEVSGVGTVLVDSSGRTLYFADEEADGSVKCVDACLGFWKPAEATGDLPTDIDGLDVITRDDTGDRQLTYDGAPLYTFTLDKAPGQVNGDDLTDSFAGTSFTWHAVAAESTGDDEESDDDGGGYGGGY